MEHKYYTCHRCGATTDDPVGWWRIEEERIIYDPENRINRRRTFCKNCYRGYQFYAFGAAVQDEDDCK